MLRHALLLATALASPAATQSLAAPGQSKVDYEAWVANPRRAAEVRRFRDYLKLADADGILPLHQLLRTASDWQDCRSTPFDVAPAALWPSIARTLHLIRAEVKPAVGDVEALSGYRNSRLNACAHGRPGSAHLLFYALDLTPHAAMSRQDMIARICKRQARTGARWNWGLGFYSGMRFHVDTKGYRRWGSDGRGATSPCAAYG